LLNCSDGLFTISFTAGCVSHRATGLRESWSYYNNSMEGIRPTGPPVRGVTRPHRIRPCATLWPCTFCSDRWCLTLWLPTELSVQGGPKNRLFLRSDNFATTDDWKVRNMSKVSEFVEWDTAPLWRISPIIAQRTKLSKYHEAQNTFKWGYQINAAIVGLK